MNPRALFLTSALIGIGTLFALLARLPSGSPGRIEAASSAAPATPDKSAGVAAGPTGRGGPRISVDAAMKELDLIRPTRPEPAPDFTVPLQGGKVLRLSAARGQVVFINFWATWCPPCREELPTMERLWRQHRDEAFVLIAVSIDAEPTAVGPFIAQHGFTFSMS